MVYDNKCNRSVLSNINVKSVLALPCFSWAPFDYHSRKVWFSLFWNQKISNMSYVVFNCVLYSGFKIHAYSCLLRQWTFRICTEIIIYEWMEIQICGFKQYIFRTDKYNQFPELIMMSIYISKFFNCTIMCKVFLSSGESSSLNISRWIMWMWYATSTFLDISLTNKFTW